MTAPGARCSTSTVAPLAGSVDRNFSPGTLTTSQNVAPLAGSVDRNKRRALVQEPLGESLPSRGAWIEIPVPSGPVSDGGVAPLAGSVDRNPSTLTRLSSSLVAPLAGSVDRNIFHKVMPFCVVVAPLAGSVDRNKSKEPVGRPSVQSLPSRGAWIEIFAQVGQHGMVEISRSPRGERG